MRNVSLCFALALLAAGCGESAVVGQTTQAAPHEVAAFYTVDFDDPTAFNCTTQDTCMSCKNITNKASAVIYHQAVRRVGLVQEISEGVPLERVQHLFAAGWLIRVVRQVTRHARIPDTCARLNHSPVWFIIKSLWARGDQPTTGQSRT